MNGASKEERFAKDLRGFGPLGLLAIVVILSGNFLLAPLSAILVLVWAALHTAARTWVHTTA